MVYAVTNERLDSSVVIAIEPTKNPVSLQADVAAQADNPVVLYVVEYETALTLPLLFNPNCSSQHYVNSNKLLFSGVSLATWCDKNDSLLPSTKCIRTYLSVHLLQRQVSVTAPFREHAPRSLIGHKYRHI